MDEDSSCTPIGKANGGENQTRYRFEDYDCLTSPRCHTVCRTLGIVLLPGLILFGGITIFITGCLINIPAMIITGAAMFVVGILFCLLCGHVCDGLTKRVRKPRRERYKSKPVVVWVWHSNLMKSLSRWRGSQTPAKPKRGSVAHDSLWRSVGIVSSVIMHDHDQWHYMFIRISTHNKRVKTKPLIVWVW